MVNFFHFSVNGNDSSVILFVILLTRMTIRPYKMTELLFSLTEKMDKINPVD
ncbi:hypothetical protein Hanom_Chr07g00587301 [Helianthus anomalus]